MDSLANYRDALKEEMQRIVSPSESSPSLVYGMLQYHLGWVDAEFRPASSYGGKHLRPILLLLTTEAQGGEWQYALPAAAALELLHNFTLIHDDIEDRDTRRRGKATLWSIWGVPQAINAGDALFTLAYRALIDLRSQPLPAHRVIQALDRYTDAVLHVTEGQCRDIAFECMDTVEEAEYLAMIDGKTAALIGLAAELGGIVAGAPEANVTALRTFGVALGKAFQMQDDLLGLWGDPERTGKPVGSDLRKHKKTLPILHGLQRSEKLRALLSQPSIGNEEVQQALSLLESVGSRSYTEAQAQRYHNQALEALASSGGQGEAQPTLDSLVVDLLDRDI